jgi:hypothetical protein
VFKVEWVFILSVLGYFISKIFSVPTFYPVFMMIALTKLSIPKNLFIKSSVFMVAVYGLIVVLSGHFFLDYEYLIGFFLLLFEFLYFFTNRDEDIDLKVLCRFFFFVSLSFWIFITLSFLNREQLDFKQLLSIFKLSHWNRDSVEVRNFMVRSLVPWTVDHWLGSVFRSFFELIGIWISIYAFRKNRPGLYFWKISLFLTLAYAVVASSRGAIITMVLMLAANLIDRFSLIKRITQLIMIASSLIVFTFSSRFLNGRDILYQKAIEGLGIIGHGIGASGALAKRLTGGDNTYVHNIHLEMMYDWGIALYLLMLIPFIFFIVKKGYFRTTVFVFVTCSLSYSIYSPWVAWTLYFAWKEDKFTVPPQSKQS